MCSEDHHIIGVQFGYCVQAVSGHHGCVKIEVCVVVQLRGHRRSIITYQYGHTYFARITNKVPVAAQRSQRMARMRDVCRVRVMPVGFQIEAGSPQHDQIVRGLRRACNRRIVGPRRRSQEIDDAPLRAVSHAQAEGLQRTCIVPYRQRKARVSPHQSPHENRGILSLLQGKTEVIGISIGLCDHGEPIGTVRQRNTARLEILGGGDIVVRSPGHKLSLNGGIQPHPDGERASACKGARFNPVGPFGGN